MKRSFSYEKVAERQMIAHPDRNQMGFLSHCSKVLKYNSCKPSLYTFFNAYDSRDSHFQLPHLVNSLELRDSIQKGQNKDDVPKKTFKVYFPFPVPRH